MLSLNYFYPLTGQIDRPVGSIGETTAHDYFGTFGDRLPQYDESLHKFFTDTQLPPGKYIIVH